MKLGRVVVGSLALAVVGCGSAAIGDGENEAAARADGGAADVNGPDAAGTPACADEDLSAWYLDADGDGYGDASISRVECAAPERYVDNGLDCDDAADDVNPLALEVCGDDIDNDCAGGDACAQALAGHWAFDELAGVVTVDDAVGNAATLRGGAQLAGTGAVVFDGIDDFVEVPHVDAYATPNGTVALWFRIGALGVRQGLWSKDSDGFDAGGHLTLDVTPVGGVRMRLQSATENHFVQSPPVAAGVWHHAVISYGAGGMKLYVDGALLGANPYTGGTEANREPTAIGSLTIVSDDLRVTPVTVPFGGSIGDVRVYQRALSDGEIGELFALTGP